jgi:hypothetical protein
MSAFVARAIASLFIGVLWAVSVFLLAVALTLFVHSAIFVHNAFHTNGVVIEMREMRSINRTARPAYKPVFRFTANDGQTYVVASNTGGPLSDFAIGELVKVLYIKNRPKTARIDSFAQLWFLPLIFGILGGTATILLVQIGRVRSRQRRRAAGITQSSET